jgi:hypothetical protein
VPPRDRPVEMPLERNAVGRRKNTEPRRDNRNSNVNLDQPEEVCVCTMFI